MSEQPDTLVEITRHVRGRILLIGRKIGQARFEIFKDALRAEAKPGKYPTGTNAIAWERGLLNKFNDRDFDSIVLHRFLYKPTKSYIENPDTLLTEVSRILSQDGVLVVNSFLLNEKTQSFRSADCFYTESEIMNLFQRHSFSRVTAVTVGDAVFFVCKK